MICRRVVLFLFLLMATTVLAPPESAAQPPTVRLKYSPFDADGTLRDGLSVNTGGIGDCRSGSFFVVGAYRCFEGSSIHSVCYRDDRDPQLPSLLCVASPWAKAAVRLQYTHEPAGSFGARPGGPPWALELWSGRRCVLLSGGTTVVGRLRLNYGCLGSGERVLFGPPDKSGPVWRIRQANDGEGHGTRKVAIRVAWR